MEKELDNDFIEALKGSEKFELNGRYGIFSGIKNPWRMPVSLMKDGKLVIEIPEEESWIVTSSNFYGIPLLEIIPDQEMLIIRKEIKDKQEPAYASIEQENTLQTEAPPAYSAPPTLKENAPNVNPLSLVGLLWFFIAPVIGLILSIVAYKQGKDKNEKDSLAIVGISINAVAVFFYFCFFALMFIGLIFGSTATVVESGVY